MLTVAGRSHTVEGCAICKSFSKRLQRVRDSRLKMLLFEKSVCPFDPELPWAETSELPFWKNASPPPFTQLSHVLMGISILCSGKTSRDKGKKQCKAQREKEDRGLPFLSCLQYRVHKSSQLPRAGVFWAHTCIEHNPSSCAWRGAVMTWPHCPCLSSLKSLTPTFCWLHTASSLSLWVSTSHAWRPIALWASRQSQQKVKISAQHLLPGNCLRTHKNPLSDPRQLHVIKDCILLLYIVQIPSKLSKPPMENRKQVTSLLLHI